MTSFDLARRDIDLLVTQAWSIVIVDEAHRVKNPKSKLTIAFNRFDCQCRFGLTGTGTLHFAPMLPRISTSSSHPE